LTDILGKPSIEKTWYNLKFSRKGRERGSEGWLFQKITVKLFFPDLGGERGVINGIFKFRDLTDILGFPNKQTNSIERANGAPKK
jgi:hypothetical protein